VTFIEGGGMLPNEFFPSDHMMVHAKLEDTTAVVQWNVAGPNVKPFEFWAPYIPEGTDETNNRFFLQKNYIFWKNKFKDHEFTIGKIIYQDQVKVMKNLKAQTFEFFFVPPTKTTRAK